MKASSKPTRREDADLWARLPGQAAEDNGSYHYIQRLRSTRRLAALRGSDGAVLLQAIARVNRSDGSFKARPSDLARATGGTLHRVDRTLRRWCNAGVVRYDGAVESQRDSERTEQWTFLDWPLQELAERAGREQESASVVSNCWLTANQAARTLGCHRGTVTRLVNRAELVGRKLGRGLYVHPRSVMDYKAKISQRKQERGTTGGATSPEAGGQTLTLWTCLNCDRDVLCDRRPEACPRCRKPGLVRA